MVPKCSLVKSATGVVCHNEASDDCYYYETRFWERDPVARVIPRQELDERMRAKFKRIYGLIGSNGCFGAMKEDRINGADIFKFLNEMAAGKDSLL
jgi:hypothetical protein